MVDLLCGHVREKAEIRKELDVEFPGAKPRCFFVRDTKCRKLSLLRYDQEKTSVLLMSQIEKEGDP